MYTILTRGFDNKEIFKNIFNLIKWITNLLKLLTPSWNSSFLIPNKQSSYYPNLVFDLTNVYVV